MGLTEIVIGAVALLAIHWIITAIREAGQKITHAINSSKPDTPLVRTDAIAEELHQIREQLERISRKMRGEPDPPTLGERLGKALAAKPDPISKESDDAERPRP